MLVVLHWKQDSDLEGYTLKSGPQSPASYWDFRLSIWLIPHREDMESSLQKPLIAQLLHATQLKNKQTNKTGLCVSVIYCHK